jgi:hypothetical protein
MTARRRQVALGCTLLLALAGCGAARDAARTLGGLQRVQAAVSKAAGGAAVQVNLMNGRYLSVSLVNSPLGELPADEKKARAEELARVAYGALPSRASLEQVSFTYVVHEQRFLIVNYTQATDVFRFQVAQLADPADAQPAPASP